jgi:hypothetical protein
MLLTWPVVTLGVTLHHARQYCVPEGGPPPTSSLTLNATVLPAAPLWIRVSGISSGSVACTGEPGIESRVILK